VVFPLRSRTQDGFLHIPNKKALLLAAGEHFWFRLVRYAREVACLPVGRDVVQTLALSVVEGWFWENISAAQSASTIPLLKSKLS